MPQPLLNTNLVLAGLPNLIDSANLVSGPVASDAAGNLLGASNLKNGSLSKIWRSLNGGNTISPSSTWFGGELTAQQRAVAAIGLVGHSLGGYTQSYGAAPVATGWWRFRGMGGGVSPLTGVLRARKTPFAILASTNYAGAVSAVQDPDPQYPDGNFLTAATPGSPTSVRFSFDQYSNIGLDTGSNNQAFRILLSRTNSGGSPTATITLYESGVSRGIIGVTSPSNVTGATTGANLQTFTWSASALSAALDDGRVQLQIDGTGAGGSSIEIGAVEWVKEWTQGAAANYVDTGILPVVLPASFPQLATPLVETYFPARGNIDSFWVDLQDAQNPNGYLQAGRFFLSDATTFQVGVDYNWGINWVDPSVRQRSQGSNVYGYRKNKWREFTGILQGLSQAEAYGSILDQLDRMKGTMGNLLCVVMPDDPNYRWMRTLYCAVKDLTSQSQDSQVLEWAPDVYSRKLVLEELL